MERHIICLGSKESLNYCGGAIEWKVKNFDRVEIGQLLAYVTINSKKYKSINPIPIYSNNDGFCIIIHNGHTYNLDALGYIFAYNKEKDSFPNIVIETTDEFSGAHIIHWEIIGGYKAIGIPLTHKGIDNLYLSAIYKNDKVCLSINFNSNAIKLKKGDTISFKFSNGKILDFTISTKPATVLPTINYPENNKEYCSLNELSDVMRLNVTQLNINRLRNKLKFNMKNNNFPLSSSDILTFISDSIISYRITYNSDGGTTIGDIPYNFEMSPKVCQEVIKDMFQVLTKAASKYNSSYTLDNMRTLKSENVTEVVFDYCYVYLMHDANTGYYKIGMSNDPTYRESTLQSEKPTIELLASHKYPSRKFAAAIESALHNIYKDFHVRGEWYKLSKEEVMMIAEGLK